MTEHRLVCFDLGGVLLRICRTWAEGCGRVGLDVRGDVDTFCHAGGAWKDLNRRYQAGGLDLGAYSVEFSRLIDGLYTPDEISRVHDGWVIDEYPDVGGIVDRLHSAGVETAALTNTCGAHWREMPRFGSVMALHHRFASHEIGLVKPDEAAFRHVELATGRTAAEIVFFDDTVENVEAARACGWRAEAVDPSRETAGQMAGVLGLG